MNSHNPSETNLDSPFAGHTSSASVSQAAQDLRSAAGLEITELTEQALKMKEKAVESAAQFRAITVEKAREVGTAALERAQALKSAASEKALQFKEVAGEQWSDTRDKAREAHSAAEDYIREHPTKCVLGALGIGFLVGLIVRR